MPAELVTTETQAANGALRLLGQEDLTDLDTQTHLAARLARGAFADERDALLREQDWNFATAWVKPARDATDAIGPLVGRYPMPEECLKVRFVQDLSLNEWALEANGVTPGAPPPGLVPVVVTNASGPLVCYTRRVTHVAVWDALFKLVFYRRLAAAIAPPLIKVSGASLRAEGDDMLPKAVTADAKEKAPQEISRDTSWLQAR